jgi:PTS system nitrogen regulatory IIA component
MLKVLVPVDDSEQALRAVRHAAFMFKDRRVSQVVLLNVQAPLEQGRACAYRSLDALRKLEEEHGKAALRPACNILDDAGATYVAQIRVGKVVPTISQAAAANDCNAIVMSTAGRMAIGALMVAMLANRVARMSRVPVTIVGSSRENEVMPSGSDNECNKGMTVRSVAMPGKSRPIRGHGHPRWWHRVTGTQGGGDSMTNDIAQIATWLQPQDILFDADVRDRPHALEVVAAAICRARGLEPAPVFRALWRREQAGSTALGEGFAIPHARIGGIARPITLFIRTRHAIAFDAPDGKPVSQLLAIMVPEDGARDDHLQLLALVARLFSDRRFRAHSTARRMRRLSRTRSGPGLRA